MAEGGKSSASKETNLAKFVGEFGYSPIGTSLTADDEVFTLYLSPYGFYVFFSQSAPKKSVNEVSKEKLSPSLYTELVEVLRKKHKTREFAIVLDKQVSLDKSLKTYSFPSLATKEVIPVLEWSDEKSFRKEFAEGNSKLNALLCDIGNALNDALFEALVEKSKSVNNTFEVFHRMKGLNFADKNLNDILQKAVKDIEEKIDSTKLKPIDINEIIAKVQSIANEIVVANNKLSALLNNKPLPLDDVAIVRNSLLAMRMEVNSLLENH